MRDDDVGGVAIHIGVRVLYLCKRCEVSASGAYPLRSSSDQVSSLRTEASTRSSVKYPEPGNSVQSTLNHEDRAISAVRHRTDWASRSVTFATIAKMPLQGLTLADGVHGRVVPAVRIAPCCSLCGLRPVSGRRSSTVVRDTPICRSRVPPGACARAERAAATACGTRRRGRFQTAPPSGRVERHRSTRSSTRADRGVPPSDRAARGS